MTFTLPYPPTANHAYTVARGRKIKTATARAYAHEVGWRVAEHMRGTSWRPTTTDRLQVTIGVHPPDSRRRDLANVEKLVVDAVCDQLNIDDSQIDRLVLERQPVNRQNPHLVLTLEAL